MKCHVHGIEQVTVYSHDIPAEVCPECERQRRGKP